MCGHKTSPAAALCLTNPSALRPPEVPVGQGARWLLRLYRKRIPPTQQAWRQSHWVKKWVQSGVFMVKHQENSASTTNAVTIDKSTNLSTPNCVHMFKERAEISALKEIRAKRKKLFRNSAFLKLLAK
jgi:hypothetical protein